MDKRVLPHTAELAPILAEIVAITRCGICLPLARIEGSVWPGINTVAMLLAENELPRVLRAVLPGLAAVPVLKIFLPFAHVSHHSLPVVVHTFSLGGVVLPLANEDVTICMDKTAET